MFCNYKYKELFITTQSMKTIIKLNNNNIRAMIQHLENIKKMNS